MTTSTRIRRFAVVAAIGVAIAACGGSDDDGDDGTADEPAEQAAEEPADEPPVDEEPADGAPADEEPVEETPADDADTGDTGDADEAASGSFEPGDIAFRSVNLLDRPVDIYVRTTGLVEAFPVEAGVAPGAVTEYAAPPADGSYVVTEAGAGDATCVTECDHFVANVSGAFGEGPTRTVLLYEDPFSGPSAFDLSEEPDSVESSAAASNLLRPADPTTGLVFPVGIALDEDVFGFRVGFDSVEGCVEAIDQPNILVGGNQTPVYPYPGDSAELQLFEQPDQDCADPVATFPVTGGPGTRTLVALQGGADGPPTGIIVELSGSVAGEAGDGGDEGSADDTALDAPTNREEFVLALLEDAPPGTDEQCVADVVAQLSDADFQVILENIDSEDIPPGLSPEGLDTLSGILDCAPA